MTTKTPPPPRKAAPKGQPPKKVEAKANLAKPEPSEIVALNFRVPAEFEKDYKIAAATLGITQSDLLQQTFRLWQQKNG